MCRRIISQEKKSLGGLNPRGILVREENFGGKPTGRKKFGGKMGPSQLDVLRTRTDQRPGFTEHSSQSIEHVRKD